MAPTPKKYSLYTLIGIAAIVVGCGSGSNPAEERAHIPDSTTSNEADNITIRKNRPIGLCAADLPRNQQHVADSITNTTVYARAKDNSAFGGLQHKYAVGRKNLYWRKNNVNVVFIGGDPTVQQRVIATARKWEPITSITFQFDQSTKDTDIAISFTPRLGTWSAIGRECKGAFPSMNFDDLYPDDDDRYYDYYVLHEFGHALGLEHEHQSYNNNIVWNVRALFNYCDATFDPRWDSSKIYHNIINRFSFEMVKATRYDPTSIMMYTFPDSVVTSGYVPQKPNYKISVLDAKFLKDGYSFVSRR